MHKEVEYSFSNYQKIKFNRHNSMLAIISLLYVVIQTMTVARLTRGEYGYNQQYIVIALVFSLATALLMYVLRYRLDYAYYKMFFCRSRKMRVFYTHNQIVGPLLVYLTVYGLGVVGLIGLLVLAKPGHDYRNFKSDVLVLNRNFAEISVMVNDLLHNPEIENKEELIGFIKYNISMFNMYEIALFDNQAKTISYEQLVENIEE